MPQVRQVTRRNAEPTARSSPPIRSGHRAADTTPKATRGWNNTKKVNGCKRHIAVNTAGLLLVSVSPRRPSRTATAPGRCGGTCPGPHFQALPSEFLDAGDTVVVLGY